MKVAAGGRRRYCPATAAVDMGLYSPAAVVVAC